MDIKVTNLWKSYGNLHVLQDFSCVFPEKKTTCIMGESGCGKTTLINILLGLETPQSGHIEGITPGTVSAVFQENRLCENLSAAANLRMVCKKRPQDDELERMFEAVKLYGIHKKPVKELSGGMRRRVAILRCLAVDFPCMIMDEPFKGLDEETRRETISYILKKAAGKTLIVVTHDEKETKLLKAEKVIRM